MMGQLQWLACLQLSAAGPAGPPPPPGPGPIANNCSDCFPTLFPRWSPVWKLDRSTIAMPCNYSGWMDPELMAQFGVVSFDWANHENSYRSRASEIVPTSNDTLCDQPHPPAGATCVYPNMEDLVAQVKKVKAVDNTTRTWIYRQGQGAPLSWTIGHKFFTDTRYDGYLLESEGCPPANASCGALPKGTRVGGSQLLQPCTTGLLSFVDCLYLHPSQLPLK